MKRAQLYVSSIGEDCCESARDFGVGIELAQFCTALAELHIALGVELVLSPKNIDLLRAGIDIRTALKDYRSESRSRKGKRSEKARGAEAGNNGSESALAPDRRHDVLILGICLDLGIP